MGKWVFEVDVNIGTRCPICGDDLEALHNHTEGRIVQESYTCVVCQTIVTFEWVKPEVTRAALRRIGAPESLLDEKEQEEREARSSGKLIIERR